MRYDERSEANPGWSDGGAALLIVADTPGAGARARSAAEAVGARIVGTVPVAEAAEALAARPGLGAVIVEVTEDGGDALDRLVDRLDLATIGLVVTVVPALIDPVVARLSPGRGELLCDPSAAERAAALGIVLARGRSGHVADGDARDVARLKALSAEVARIAGVLAELSGDAVPVGWGGAAEPVAVSPAAARDIDPALIRAMIRERRLRERFFDAGLFGEPAWDMLLDLMAARLEAKPVSVSSLCIAAAVPATTALRAIGTLTESGLFERRPDPADARRVLIALTDRAAAAMAAYLDALTMRK